MAHASGRNNGAPFAEPLLRSNADAVTTTSTASLDSVGSDPSPSRLHRHRRHSPVLAPAAHDDSHIGALQQPYIGLASVVAIEFFNVSGGPWGSEDVFSYGGPLMGTAAIIVFAVCFSLPQCLVTAELCCAYPSNGGYAVWVREAFGDFWAFQEVYWQWVSGVVDAAVYPVLITDSALELLGWSDLGRDQLWMVRLLAVLLLSTPAFASITRVPSMLITLAVATGAPLAAFIARGIADVRPQVWLQVQQKSVNYGGLINVVFWNMEGWDCIATCSALIQEPREKVVPRGLFTALALASVQYIIVLLVAAGVSEGKHPWKDWNDGSLPTIADSIAPWVGVLLMVASLFGNAGQYLSEFMEDSFALQGAAEIGIVPGIFSKQHPESGSPYMANLAQFLVISLLVVFDFSQILVFDNFFTGSAVALQFLAFVTLRWQQPALHRPYRVPSYLLPLLIPGFGLLGVMLHHCLVKAGNASLLNVLAFSVGVPYGLWVSRRSAQTEQNGHRSILDELLEADEI
mmetsp:Transcript_66182/g.123545  ORF Transcript_66182/g.123545 Transcript_66182/m.123545 type:complete len:516 (-) Transcript_66182:12-1559(-)